jgi:hypothetical protein
MTMSMFDDFLLLIFFTEKDSPVRLELIQRRHLESSFGRTNIRRNLARLTKGMQKKEKKATNHHRRASVTSTKLNSRTHRLDNLIRNYLLKCALFVFKCCFLFHFAVRRMAREPSLFMGVSPDKQDNIYSEFNRTEKYKM